MKHSFSSKLLLCISAGEPFFLGAFNIIAQFVIVMILPRKLDIVVQSESASLFNQILSPVGKSFALSNTQCDLFRNRNWVPAVVHSLTTA